MAVTSASILGLLTATAVLLTILYYRALPKPLPGIPYNHAATKSILGDLPEMMAAAKRPQGLWPWLGDLGRRHKSAVVQIFPRPFGAPLVVVVDGNETNNLARRHTVFDRSDMHKDVFSSVIPEHHIMMKSSDPRLKLNRELIRDFLVPSFHNEISAPAIYEAITGLVEMWRYKIQVGKGRPFEVSNDLFRTALEIIWREAFGQRVSDERIFRIQDLRDLCEPTSAVSFNSKSEAVEFPEARLPADFQAIMNVIDSLKIGLSSPVPRLHLRLAKMFTSLGRDFDEKEKILGREIQRAVDRLSKTRGEDTTAVRCAMDHMVAREMRAAGKEGRPAVFHSRRMLDELFGIVIAGHDTSATTLAWMLKYLTDNQPEQDLLRTHLQAVFPDARKGNRPPSAQEIIKTSAPYLDAWLEEGLRRARTLSVIMRQTTSDTSILGHPVPKGTIVWFDPHGPSVTEPAISSSRASGLDTNDESKERLGTWSDEDVALFRPERWLKHKDGRPGAVFPRDDIKMQNVEFDPLAGPQFAFSVGARQCAGRKLAYMELRITIALLVWNFVFQKCPPELSTYDAVDDANIKPKQCFVRLESAV